MTSYPQVSLSQNVQCTQDDDKLTPESVTPTPQGQLPDSQKGMPPALRENLILRPQGNVLPCNGASAQTSQSNPYAAWNVALELATWLSPSGWGAQGPESVGP